MAAAQTYIEHLPAGEALPTLAGLALYLGKNRSTLAEYTCQSPEIAAVAEQVQTMQEIRLINGGLTGEYNAAFAKLLLTKHGYSDKQEIDHTGTAISPPPPMSAAEIMAVLEKAKEIL
ncbi:terminase small subunit [Neisseria yangbaofengii]|uniref:terminase small subunit n=1 Tax=Neisseria yangbaofengii TaxID=2709396 RepID=UPI00280C3149|nr:terminase small subunit [Neisseria yangbaofengii]